MKVDFPGCLETYSAIKLNALFTFLLVSAEINTGTEQLNIK